MKFSAKIENRRGNMECIAFICYIAQFKLSSISVCDNERNEAIFCPITTESLPGVRTGRDDITIKIGYRCFSVSVKIPISDDK